MNYNLKLNTMKRIAKHANVHSLECFDICLRIDNIWRMNVMSMIFFYIQCTIKCSKINNNISYLISNERYYSLLLFVTAHPVFYILAHKKADTWRMLLLLHKNQ